MPISFQGQQDRFGFDFIDTCGSEVDLRVRRCTTKAVPKFKSGCTYGGSLRDRSRTVMLIYTTGRFLSERSAPLPIAFR